MATATDEEIRWLASQMASQLLVRAGDPTPERLGALRLALADWMPGADEFELRRVADAVAISFRRFARLLDDRLERLEDKGQAKAFHG
jgi:hypothetical protein